MQSSQKRVSRSLTLSWTALSKWSLSALQSSKASETSLRPPLAFDLWHLTFASTTKVLNKIWRGGQKGFNDLDEVARVEQAGVLHLRRFRWFFQVSRKSQILRLKCTVNLEYDCACQPQIWTNYWQVNLVWPVWSTTWIAFVDSVLGIWVKSGYVWWRVNT